MAARGEMRILGRSRPGATSDTASSADVPEAARVEPGAHAGALDGRPVRLDVSDARRPRHGRSLSRDRSERRDARPYRGREDGDRPRERDRRPDDRQRERYRERDDGAGHGRGGARERQRDCARQYDREHDRERGRRGDARERSARDRSASASRSRSRSRDRHGGRRQRAGSDSRSPRQRRKYSSASDSDDSSASDDSGRRRHRRRERERRDEREDRHRRKDRDRARDKRARDKGKRKTAASTSSWGRHGTISEADMAARNSEFRAWLIEERKLNPENVSRERTKKEFATFVEDYNTATLPHEKYYDMAKYEFKMNLIRTGQTLPLEPAGYDAVADMRAHRSSLKRPAQTKELSRAEVEDLRRIQTERREIGQRRMLGLEVPPDMGVRHEDALVVVSVEYRD